MERYNSLRVSIEIYCLHINWCSSNSYFSLQSIKQYFKIAYKQGQINQQFKPNSPMKHQYSFSVIIFAIFVIASTDQIAFQTFNHTAHPAILIFQARAGDFVQIFVQYSIPLSMISYYMFKRNETRRPETLRQSNYYSKRFQQVRGTEPKFEGYVNETDWYVFIQSTSDDKGFIYNRRVTLFINNFKMLENFQVLYLIHLYSQIWYQLQVQAPCKVKIYWKDAQYTGSSLQIFHPTSDILTSIPYSILYYDVSDTEGKTIYLNKSGKWKIYRFQRLIDVLGVINITTFSDSKCTNICSRLPYPVVGLSPGTTDTCICDMTIPGLIWDCSTKQCLMTDRRQHCSFCGNSIIEERQQCDNGGNDGCSECRSDKPNEKDNCEDCGNSSKTEGQGKSKQEKFIILAVFLVLLTILLGWLIHVRQRCVEKKRQINPEHHNTNNSGNIWGPIAQISNHRIEMVTFSENQSDVDLN